MMMNLADNLAAAESELSSRKSEASAEERKSKYFALICSYNILRNHLFSDRLRRW